MGLADARGFVLDDDEWPSRALLDTDDQTTPATRRLRRAVAEVRVQVGAFILHRQRSKAFLYCTWDAWAGYQTPAHEEVIDQAVRRAKIDKGIELSDKKLCELPRGVLHLEAHLSHDLRRLSVAQNRLRELPKRLFDRFSGLNNLCLFGNKLRVLPPSIGKLKHLQMLFVNDNELCILPVELGELEAMHTFHVQNNPDLRQFPLEFGKLQHNSMGGHLQEIKYDMDTIEYLPREIGDQGLVLTCDMMSRMWDASWVLGTQCRAALSLTIGILKTKL